MCRPLLTAELRRQVFATSTTYRTGITLPWMLAFKGDTLRIVDEMRAEAGSFGQRVRYRFAPVLPKYPGKWTDGAAAQTSNGIQVQDVDISATTSMLWVQVGLGIAAPTLTGEAYAMLRASLATTGKLWVRRQVQLQPEANSGEAMYISPRRPKNGTRLHPVHVRHGPVRAEWDHRCAGNNGGNDGSPGCLGRDGSDWWCPGAPVRRVLNWTSAVAAMMGLAACGGCRKAAPPDDTATTVSPRYGYTCEPLTSEELIDGACENAAFLGEVDGHAAGFFCERGDPVWLIACETLYAGMTCEYCGWDKAPNKPKDIERATEIGSPCYLDAFCQAFVENARVGCDPPDGCDGY